MIRESIGIQKKCELQAKATILTQLEANQMRDWVTFIGLGVLVVLLVREPFC